MIITNVTDMVFHKNNKEHRELCDKLDKISLDIKDLELEKIKLQKIQLETEYKLRELEYSIARMIIK